MVFKQEEKLPGNSFYAPLRKVMQVNAGLDHLFLLYHVIIFWSLISKARGENELGNLIVFTEIGKPLFIDVTSSWSFLFFFLCVCVKESECSIVSDLWLPNTGNSFMLCAAGTWWFLTHSVQKWKTEYEMLARGSPMLTRKMIAFSNNVLRILLWRKSITWTNSDSSIVFLFSRQEINLFWSVEFEKFSKLPEFQPVFSC